MRYTNIIITAIGMSTVATSLASADFIRIEWQGSSDNGATWTGARIEVANPGQSVRVRALADWQHPDAYAFAAVFMDVMINGQSGAGAQDEASNFVRPEPLANVQQTIVSRRFGSIIKIDDERDTDAPGVGLRTLSIGQPPEIAGAPFTRERPLVVFEFMLRLDGSAGTRIVEHLYNRNSVGDESTPRLYSSPQGGIFFPQPSLKSPLEIVVLPSPSAALLVGCGSFMLAGRRRRL